MTHSFNAWFQLQAEALYSIKGAESEDGLLAFNFNYLEIPTIAKFKV